MIASSTMLGHPPLTLKSEGFPKQMADFSDVFRFSKMRSGNPAVYLLREQFEKFTSSPQKLDVCESIAHCFYQLEQYEDAANWYETAGRIILAGPNTLPAVKALLALDEYERALECYGRDENDEKFTECSTLIADLRRACASA